MYIRATYLPTYLHSYSLTMRNKAPSRTAFILTSKSIGTKQQQQQSMRLRCEIQISTDAYTSNTHINVSTDFTSSGVARGGGGKGKCPPSDLKKISGYVINCKLSCLILVPRKFTIIYHFKQQLEKFRTRKEGSTDRN